MERRQPRFGDKHWGRDLIGDPVRERQNLTSRALKDFWNKRAPNR